jgi:MFS family permease
MPDVRRARIAIAVVFAVHGAVVGTFATRLPWIAHRLDTDPGGLGVALLVASIGAMLTMPIAGRLVHRFPTRPVVAILLTLWCLVVILPSLATSVPLLALAMLFYGIFSGMSDVAMNAQGVVVEQRAGKSIMSGLHGMWSAGGLAGSAGGIIAAHAGVDARLHFTIVALALTVIGLVACRYLLDVPAPEDDAPAFALPPKPVILIALVAFCAVFAEGASSDWAAVYLTDIAHAGAGIAAAAVSGFAGTMAVARLVGDRVVNRFGSVATVRLGGSAAAIGALVVAVARVPALAIIGFGLIGLGVAVVVPLAFTAAGNAGPRPGAQIAGVATIAYGAGLAAPASIGGIAHVSSLSVSFLVVAALAALVALGAGKLRRGAATPVEVTEPVADSALDPA